MDTHQAYLSVIGCRVIILLCWLFSSVAQGEFPDFRTLSQSNVSLRMEGFDFTSGLQPNQQGKPNGQGTQLVKAGWCGSGFLIKSDGTIATNYHVARRALRGTAIFQSGATYEVLHIRVYNRNDDLAVLKIRNTEPLPSVQLGNSDGVQVMEKVLAVGNSLCQELSVTDGIVNQVLRDKRTDEVAMLRHSAPIAPGNSGGALYKNNEVVGVNVSSRPPYQIHYAIPVKKLMPLMQPQYDRMIFLEDAFPANIQAMVKKFKETLARTGQVEAKSGQGPALWKLKVDLWDLQDVAIFLQAQSGRDLDLAVWNQEGKLIGYSETVGGEDELLLLANGFYQTVTIGVLNYETTPANFGVKVYNVNW